MLRITELVASNDNTLNDYDGDSSDWLEIYNSGSAAVDLSGMYLSDNESNLTKWAFPAGTAIAGGGYRVVFASSKNTVKPNGELHTNFALSADGEFLGLIGSDGTTVIDAYSPEFPSQGEDVPYGRAMQPTGESTTLVSSGAFGRAWVPTTSAYDASWTSASFNDAFFNISGQAGFGFEGNPGDAVNFTAEIKTTVPSGIRSLYLRIPFTITSLTGIDQLTLRMMYDDGFVAYINGVQVAEANAPELPRWDSIATTLPNDADAERFQDFDAGLGISALRVGQNVLAIHALNISTTSSDMLIQPELVAKSSTIAIPEDVGYFDVPTPGYGNPPVNFAGFAVEPVMSVPHGFYSTTQLVNLSTPTSGAVIVYTTNGSTPAVNASGSITNGTLYTGPIAVSGTTTLRARAFRTDFKPSFVSAATYLFLDDIITQSPTGQTPPGFAPNGLNGQRMDYGIDPDIIALYGEQAVKDSLASLPAISITTDVGNLFDASTGIYVNANFRGRPWERPASVELINPDGSPGFMVNAGLRIRGGYSRGDFNPKHAFRLYFRGDYGSARLEYPLFGEEGVSEFDVLDLRTDQNYAWSTEGNLQNSMVREVFSRDLQRDLDEPYTRSRYYHLYLDGAYWGVFMTQERVEEFYGESYFGGDEADYDVVKHGLGDVGGTEISAGNDAAWRQLFNYGEQLAANPSANANLFWAMQGLNPDGTRNPSLPVLLDVDNLVDFMLSIVYTGGYDSGISSFLGDNKANNWFGIYNRAAADQGFQFFVHDNEHSLGAAGSYHGSLSIDRTGPFNFGNQSNFEQFNPGYLHQDLLAHPEYKQAFIDRVQQYFFNAGPLTVESNLLRMLARVTQVDPAVIAEAARWGDAQRSTPANKQIWQNEINWLLKTYFPARGPLVLNQLRADGLATTFSAPVFSQHGGQVSEGYALTMTAATGTIYYTTDGATDPRLIGGGVNPSAAVSVYAGHIPITADAKIRARVRTPSGQWSGLVEASFVVVPSPADYTGDSWVDGADFMKWQRQYGTTAIPAASGSDGSNNGRIDLADLAIWRNNFGRQPTVNSYPTAAAGSAKDIAFAVQAAQVSAWHANAVRSDANSVGGTDHADPFLHQRSSCRIEPSVAKPSAIHTLDLARSNFELTWPRHATTAQETVFERRHADEQADYDAALEDFESSLHWRQAVRAG